MIDEIVKRRLRKIERRESRPIAMIADLGFGTLFKALKGRADRSELARIFAGSALESFYTDKTEKEKLKQASEILKRKVEDQARELLAKLSSPCQSCEVN